MIEQAPPRELLDRYNAYYKGDPPFRAWCRLKQSVYREKKEWKAGRVRSGDDRTLGNYLTDSDAERGNNFLSPQIFESAKKRIKAKVKGEVIQPDRLFRNMLTSQTLCFNLFLPQMDSLDLANKIWTTLYPKLVRKVTRVLVEYSPGRADTENYTGDKSAFDAYVEFDRVAGGRGMIGIEVKYTDSFSGSKKVGSSKSDINSRKALERVYTKSQLYSETGWSACKAMRTEQLWRTHLLAESMRDSHKFDSVVYMVLHAAGDEECFSLLPEYIKNFKDLDAVERVFLQKTLEDFCGETSKILKSDELGWIQDFQERYLFDCEQLVRASH